ncbi:MAG TPA: 30S ribosomal protein S7, partial [Phycisphaerales bacterium]|nr:30S ribosomal protein S7 [Phycisphaerales bacterium]
EMFDYDGRGNRTSEIRDAQGIRQMTATKYDAFGRIERFVDGNNVVYLSKYEGIGRAIETWLEGPGGQRRLERVVYDAFDIIADKLAKETDPNAPKDPLDLFLRSIDSVKPYVEVRSKRIGGANYQVPMQVNRKRQQSLAFRWIIEAVRSEKGRPMCERLADELYLAAQGQGKAMQTRDQTHKMAEANRAFAHFAN